MNNVLVDTCFWFAYFDERDSHYQEAHELMKIISVPLKWDELNN